MKTIATYRILAWSFGLLLILALSVLGSVLYHTRIGEKTCETSHATDSSGMFMRQQLGLSENQHQQMESIMLEFRDSSFRLLETLRGTRITLMDELAKPEPDSATLSRLASEIGTLQTQITRQAALQYLRIRSICTPDQQLRLSDIYCDRLGCPRMGMGKQNDDQHRNQHRHQYGKDKIR
jgi:Spy/CpxP family protein refolding chaperone